MKKSLSCNKFKMVETLILQIVMISTFIKTPPFTQHRSRSLSADRWWHSSFAASYSSSVGYFAEKSVLW